MKYAQVQEVYLNDDSDFGPYSIQAMLKSGNKNQRITAIPLNINQKYIPVVGEYVCVQKAPSDKNTALGTGRTVYYYTSAVSLQGNINNNILENATTITAQSAGSDYSRTENGIPNTTTRPPSEKKNSEFVEVSNVSQLQPFAGDVIHEGRFGQSIRLGYTPEGSDSNIKPSWSSTESESPITILRNTANGSGYNKFVIEDVNEDDSSVWLTSKQTVSLTLSSNLPLGVTPQSTWNSPQIILNSDRIVINSKADEVIVSSGKDISLTTSTNTTSLDRIVEVLEEILKGKYPTAVGPTGPHPLIATLLPKLKNGV